ncbi:MAG TPA: c-type cytochrome [Polyangiaceae bacterium]|jgi:cytochrome c5
MDVLRSVVLAPLMLLAFCNENASKNQPSGAPSATGPATVAAQSPEAEAKDIFKVRCAMCHGPSGNGDGPTAATLNPKPRDFGAKDWQKSVTDSQLRAIIVGGGTSVGKSPLMPSNPDLNDKPAVADELVKIVRGFGK